jgi:hypothetical protein
MAASNPNVDAVHKQVRLTRGDFMHVFTVTCAVEPASRLPRPPRFRPATSARATTPASATDWLGLRLSAVEIGPRQHRHAAITLVAFIPDGTGELPSTSHTDKNPNSHALAAAVLQECQLYLVSASDPDGGGASFSLSFPRMRVVRRQHCANSDLPDHLFNRATCHSVELSDGDLETVVLLPQSSGGDNLEAGWPTMTTTATTTTTTTLESPLYDVSPLYRRCFTTIDRRHRRRAAWATALERHAALRSPAHAMGRAWRAWCIAHRQWKTEQHAAARQVQAWVRRYLVLTSCFAVVREKPLFGVERVLHAHRRLHVNREHGGGAHLGVFGGSSGSSRSLVTSLGPWGGVEVQPAPPPPPPWASPVLINTSSRSVPPLASLSVLKPLSLVLSKHAVGMAGYAQIPANTLLSPDDLVQFAKGASFVADGVPFNVRDAAMIGDALSSNTSVQRVLLYNGRLGNRGAEAILTSVFHNPHNNVHHVAFGANHIGFGTVAKLASMMLQSAVRPAVAPTELHQQRQQPGEPQRRQHQQRQQHQQHQHQHQQHQQQREQPQRHARLQQPRELRKKRQPEQRSPSHGDHQLSQKRRPQQRPAQQKRTLPNVSIERIRSSDDRYRAKVHTFGDQSDDMANHSGADSNGSNSGDGGNRGSTNRPSSTPSTRAATITSNGGFLHLRTIAFESNPRIGPTGAKFLSQVVADKRCCIASLTLERCSVGDAGATVLAASLFGNVTLAYLGLSGNRITDRGAMALATCLGLLLSPSSSAVALSLSRSSATSSSSAAVSGLQHRAVAWSALPSSGRACRLQHLNLSHNEVSNAGLCSLMSALAGTAHQGVSSNVSTTSSTTVGVEVTAASSAAPPAAATPEQQWGVPPSPLQVLDVSHNCVGDDGAAALARALRSIACRNLKRVNLSGNNIHIAGMRALHATICLGASLLATGTTDSVGNDDDRSDNSDVDPRRLRDAGDSSDSDGDGGDEPAIAAQSKDIIGTTAAIVHHAGGASRRRSQSPSEFIDPFAAPRATHNGWTWTSALEDLGLFDNPASGLAECVAVGHKLQVRTTPLPYVKHFVSASSSSGSSGSSSTKRGSASASTKSGSGSGSGSFGDGGAGLASNVDVAGAATRTAGDHGAPPSSAPVVAASGGASNGGKSKWLADLPPALLKKGNRFRKFAPAAGRS